MFIKPNNELRFHLDIFLSHYIITITEYIISNRFTLKLNSAPIYNYVSLSIVHIFSMFEGSCNIMWLIVYINYFSHYHANYQKVFPIRS